ncbi:MAG TPA: diaminopimelate decarboxylase [Candidatus Angelobacter sp.]|jgi:diaminopimelate decarboxylase|nr:diaminopimelate decarboxylase [Candidatus Angelobacter sp.]
MFTRPPGFTYKNDELHCDGLGINRLAKKFGTPLYLYSATAIRERYRVFEGAFHHVKHTLCYSVKANSNLSILRLLAGMGAGFDIVSGGELERVRRAHKKSLSKIVFSGVGKTAEELRLALRGGILLFNVESEGELELLASCAAELRKVADIAFRVNPDVPAETHPYISTGLREHKFGVPISSARELCRHAAGHKYLRVAGVSLHIGSQIGDVTPFHLAMERAVDLALELIADGHKIRFIDAGGGLGISYNSSARVEFNDLAHRYEEAVTEPLLRMKKPVPHLLLEPGRSIIAPAGALVTRVLYLKRNGNKRFTIVDAAMNDLIRPSLYQARHEITPVNLVKGRSERVQSDIAGPVCESGDFLARDAMLPAVAPGENLCILDAGAYGMSLASNYNTRPRAAEVLVDGKRARLIRRRETMKDLLQQEAACL